MSADVGQRVRAAAVVAWPLVQLTAAATVAWTIARAVGDHPDPFFAPIAAVAALSSPLGERGRNAVRLLLGVFIGIGAGEITLWLFGGGYGRLALATFAATVVARVLASNRLVVVQAAAGAVLTVASANGDAGVDRLADALIGSAVALVGSQFLFSPEPVGLVRRAEATALRAMASALKKTADALEVDDAVLSERSLEELRAMRDDLAELARLRRASHRVARHSVVWRHQMSPVVRESEDAGHLDLLGVSCLTLARTSMAVRTPDRTEMVAPIQELAVILEDVAAAPGDRTARQRAVDRSVAVAHHTTPQLQSVPMLGVAQMAVRIVAGDIMVFAGVEPDEVLRALEEGSTNFDVPTPPSAPRLPFRTRRRRRG